MSIKQSPQQFAHGRQFRAGHVHSGPKARPFAAANRSPAVAAPGTYRLQSNRTAPPPRKSPGRQIRGFRCASSNAVTKTHQNSSNLSQNALAKQMQLLNVSSPIGKHIPRCSSAISSAPSQPEKPPTGSFRRRAAHLQALEASRRNRSAQDEALAAATYSVRAKDACSTLRANLSALMFKLDFYAVDRFARGRGEEALAPLCQQLEQLSYLAQSFARIAVPGDQRAFPAASKGPASLRIKGYVVALQSVADRLPASPGLGAGQRLAQVVDQGLLEQILSWVGEVDASCDLVRALAPKHPAPALAHPPARQGLAAPAAARPDVRRRMLGVVGGKRAEPCSSPDSASSGEGGEDRRLRRRERMQRHRPPQLLIPETSFERKPRR